MADVGPSSSVRPVTPPSSSHQRGARIHFPVKRGPINDNGSCGALYSLGLGPPPALRKLTNQTGSLSFQQDDKRRRVRSVDTPDAFDQARFRGVPQGSSPRRTTSFSKRADYRELMTVVASGMPETFSDEFDLCECFYATSCGDD